MAFRYPLNSSGSTHYNVDWTVGAGIGVRALAFCFIWT